MRKKRVYVFIGIAMMLLFSCGCDKNNQVQDKKKIQLYTSVYPLEDFSKKIGKNHVEVKNLVPPGTEPHDFELTAQELVKLSEADVFVYNGAGFEGWIDQIRKNLNPQKTAMIDTSKGLPVATRNGRMDPHIWLDPKIAQGQALKIKDALVRADVLHKEEYEHNYQQLCKQFDQIDHEYQAMVKRASVKEFVVSHAAFHYLADRYGLRQIPITGLSPMDEPSSKELQMLIELMVKHHLRHIFFETLVSNKLADVIRREVNAEVLILNPLEGLTEEEIAHGADYFSVMKKNKDNLAIALGAK